MKKTENMFKSKANIILKKPPRSMKEFLENSSENRHEKSDVQINKCAEPQILNSSNENESSEDHVRLHVHIKQDLANKVLELVYQRKRNHKTKKEASQRAIIEEALEMYFKED
jgi:hypothetical protein